MMSISLGVMATHSIERVRDILVIKYGYDKEFYGGSVLWEDFQKTLIHK